MSLKKLLIAIAAFLMCLMRAESKEHEIVVNGARALIDGVLITRTAPFNDSFATTISYDAAVRALGKPDRSGYGHNDLVIVWDSYGFSMLRDGKRPEDGPLLNFAVQLRKREAAREMDSKGTFTGSLFVNGIRLTSTTRLMDVAHKLSKTGFRTVKTGERCYSLEKPHYSMNVCGDKDGFVSLLIFYSNQGLSDDERP